MKKAILIPRFKITGIFNVLIVMQLIGEVDHVEK